MHWHRNFYIFCIIFLSIIYFTCAVSKWHTIFKYYYFISFIFSFCCIISSCSSNCYSCTYSMFTSRQSYKIDLNSEVLSLIWLLVLYVPYKSSFISSQIFVLNLVGWFGVLSNNVIIFWYSIIILLYLESHYQKFSAFLLEIHVFFFIYVFLYQTHL